jgi:SAM-dependent methyltransferase
MKDFSKDFFQNAWGEDGYYETFNYGVGYLKVCEVGITPFYDENKKALEIGPGGGTFTQFLINKFKHLIAIDVIKMPRQFSEYKDFTYLELNDKYFTCPLPLNYIDFCFSYNVFCHLSNDALKQYIESINKVMKVGGDFVFMLSNISHSGKFDDVTKYTIGDMLPMGHFYQDDRTIDLIVDFNQWDIVNRNMLPNHRDILVHLKKKKCTARIKRRK